MKKRDAYLDSMRSLAMIWVMWVHSIYWLGYFPVGPLSVARSYFLVEMPLLFFLTGAGRSLTAEKTFGQTVLEGWRRVLVPYWFYGLLCLALELFFGNGAEGLGRAALSWLLPLDRQITSFPILTGALWYVPVYLLCLLLIPLLRRWKKQPYLVIPLLLLMLLAGVMGRLYYLQNISFYSLWIYAGLWYPEGKRYFTGKKRQLLLLTALLAGAVLGLLCGPLGFCPDMQKNKFPPNFLFLVYSAMSMSLLLWASRRVVKWMDFLKKAGPFRWLFDRLGRYSLTVFLYHPLVFLLLLPLNSAGPGWGIPYSVLWLGSFALLVPLTALLTVIFGRLESLGRRKKHECI